MIVNKVSVNLRYSADTGAGSWRTVELGAEASLEGDESLEVGTQELYRQVKAELAAIWHSAVKDQPAAAPPAPAQPAYYPPPAPAYAPPAGYYPAPPPAADPASWCPIHAVSMTLQQNERGSWYSHKAAAGGFCKGK